MSTSRAGVYRDELVEYRQSGPSRVNALEDRVTLQERTLKNLIERAFKIKEDVINSLNFTRGTWQEEQKARVSLQDHVKTITNIVNKLSHEISSIEEQIRARDSSAVNTNAAVKNLEVHHVASLTDLRGRVVRCDTSITKLSADIRNISEAIKSLSQTQVDASTKTLERIHMLEGKISSVNNSIDKAYSEQTMKIQHVEGDTSHQINVLDTKTRSMIEEVRATVKSLHASVNSDLERMEYRLMQHVEKSSVDTESKLNLLAKKMDDNNKQMEIRFLKMEESLDKERNRVDTINKTLEMKLTSRLESDLQKQTKDVTQLKRECRQGFGTVHETITNMKTVVDGKRRLLEDQLRKDISQIRKMVVLV